MEHRLLNINETAEFLKIKKSTLYQWVSMQKIPYVKMGRRVLFDLKDLDALIEKNKVKAFDFDKFSQEILTRGRCR